MGESSFLNPAKAIAAAQLHEGMRVADFGAGSGFFTRAAARVVGERGVVWAVDVNRDILSRIKSVATAEGLTNVEIVHGDVAVEGGTHLDADSFDAVIAANLFFAAEQKEAVVGEIRRVLKVGGMALILDWQDSFGGLGPHPTHVVSQEQVVRLFEAAGFTHAGDIPAGAYHWGFVVKKRAR